MLFQFILFRLKSAPAAVKFNNSSMKPITFLDVPLSIIFQPILDYLYINPIKFIELTSAISNSGNSTLNSTSNTSM